MDRTEYEAAVRELVAALVLRPALRETLKKRHAALTGTNRPAA